MFLWRKLYVSSCRRSGNSSFRECSELVSTYSNNLSSASSTSDDTELHWTVCAQVRKRWFLRAVCWLEASSQSYVRRWQLTVCRRLKPACRRPTPNGRVVKTAARRRISAARARTTRAASTVRGCRTATVSHVSVTRPASNWATAVSTTRAPVDVSHQQCGLS